LSIPSAVVALIAEKRRVKSRVTRTAFEFLPRPSRYSMSAYASVAKTTRRNSRASAALG
jgi:hypothetical protein